MGDTSNVIAGSGTLRIAPSGTAIPVMTSLPISYPAAWITSGYTDDGVDFTYTPSFKDITVDEELGAVQTLQTGEKLEISLKMAETTLLNLQKAIAGSTLSQGPTSSTLYLGSAATTSEWVAIFEGPCPGAGGTRVITVYRIKSKAAVSFKYQRKDKVVYAVKFEALVDSTQPAGQRLAKAIDYNPAGS